MDETTLVCLFSVRKLDLIIQDPLFLDLHTKARRLDHEFEALNRIKHLDLQDLATDLLVVHQVPRDSSYWS